jgi:hypothetical protein
VNASGGRLRRSLRRVVAVAKAPALVRDPSLGHRQHPVAQLILFG